jgi:hypothetical protein
MIGKGANQFNWRLPFYGALGAAVVLLPKIIFGNDITTLLIMILAAAVVSLILLVVVFLKLRLQALSVLSMLAVFCVVSWLLFKASDEVHMTGRWLIQSERYKDEVLAQPAPANGELRHAEWEGWGFAGAGDTVMYLVFDPNNSLAIAAKSHSPGKFSGIPCEVPRVRRLEDHWYSVLFYTDTSWDHCT